MMISDDGDCSSQSHVAYSLVPRTHQRLEQTTQLACTYAIKTIRRGFLHGVDYGNSSDGYTDNHDQMNTTLYALNITRH